MLAASCQLLAARPFACSMKDAKNFHLAFLQAVKNDKWCSCNYQLASSVYPALAPQIGILFQNVDAGKDPIHDGICSRRRVFA